MIFPLEGYKALDAACGEDFSIILVERRDGAHEVYSTGNNSRGQLGINRVCHLSDLTISDDISGVFDRSRSQPIKISQIACGRRHCIATFDYGAFFIWGDNEFGQLGDQKRRFLESPYPKAKFERKHNVENVICGIDSCAVIVERFSTPEGSKEEEKNKKKKKRVLKMDEITSGRDAVNIADTKPIEVKPTLTQRFIRYFKKKEPEEKKEEKKEEK